MSHDTDSEAGNTILTEQRENVAPDTHLKGRKLNKDTHQRRFASHTTRRDTRTHEAVMVEKTLQSHTENTYTSRKNL